MINRLIEIEQKRYEELGYQTIVKPISYTIGKSLEQVNIGNDSYILTGIRVANNEMFNDVTEVCITSSNDCLQCTQRQLAEMGTSISKLFKGFITILTRGESGYIEEQDIQPYRLDFIKISPIKKNLK